MRGTWWRKRCHSRIERRSCCFALKTMPVKTVALTLLYLLAVPLCAQETAVRQPFTVGLELDALPYATGGYFGAFWAGKGHWRGRLIVARATKPDFLLPKGYTDNSIRAYALLADYFPKQHFKGWWLAAGLVYWDAGIRYTPDQESAGYKSYLLSGGAGYHWFFYRNFYLSPWAGLHVRAAGDDSVRFPGATYKPPRLNPEGSVKLGWRIGR